METRTIYQVGDYRTLPAVFVRGITTECMPAFGRGRVKLQYVDPEYGDLPYKYSVENLSRASLDSAFAKEIVQNWNGHQGSLGYYLQFRDDTNGEKLKSFHSHTELASAILEDRLGIPTASLWETFEFLLRFKFAQEDYRSDQEREKNYERHAKSLESLQNQYNGRFQAATDIGRALQQIDIRIIGWKEMTPIHVPLKNEEFGSKTSLFYSYSHKDESLRDELEKHLSGLQRSGLIDQWHDRRIGSGEEWKGAIDEHLRSACLILLLISSDFLASNYCYDVEMALAMERHQLNEARVIPIFLRPCDWEGSPFGKLQGLPTDAKAVTTWQNQDEAFTNIAKGIRKAIQSIKDEQSGSRGN